MFSVRVRLLLLICLSNQSFLQKSGLLHHVLCTTCTCTYACILPSSTLLINCFGQRHHYLNQLVLMNHKWIHWEILWLLLYNVLLFHWRLMQQCLNHIFSYSIQILKSIYSMWYHCSIHVDAQLIHVHVDSLCFAACTHTHVHVHIHVHIHTFFILHTKCPSIIFTS